MKRLLIVFTLIFLTFSSEAQHIIVTIAFVPGAAMYNEHGFLPGKKFKFYPATRPYDVHGIKLRVELHDERDSLKLQRLECSSVDLTNTSEFEGTYGLQVVEKYIDSLFPPANIVLDTTASDVLKVNLKALDSRLIGAFSVRAHGLCEMSVEWKGNTHEYCVDITDKDPHSPISSHAFVTRETGTRIITSAAVREVLEKVITDLEFDK